MIVEEISGFEKIAAHKYDAQHHVLSDFRHKFAGQMLDLEDIDYYDA
jgi:hypothetical protein